MILFILMPEKYRDEEFYEPYNILKKQKYNIDVANFKKGEAVGVNGYRHIPNLLLSDLDTKDFINYDALVIPGGPGSIKYLWNNKEIQKIIKFFHENQKVVAAICYAVIAPVQSGILSGKQATVYATDEAKKILEENNVIFSHEGCVNLENDKIITAQGPAFAKEFGIQIASLLKK